LTIPRHLDRQRTVIRQDRFAARAVAMIGDLLRLAPAGRIAEVMGELAAEGALNDGFLEAADRRLQLLVRQRPLPNKLIEDLRQDRRQGRVRRQAFPFAAHRLSSCYAPHTKFLTLSFATI